MIGILAYLQDLVSWKPQELTLVKAQSWTQWLFPLQQTVWK